MFRLRKGEWTIVILKVIEDILHNQNDINESARMQLDNITLVLAEFAFRVAKTEVKAKDRLYTR